MTSTTRIKSDNLQEVGSNFFALFNDGEEIAGGSHFERLVQDDRAYFYVASSGNNRAGYILAYRFPALFQSAQLAYLYDIEVLPDFRRKGIGKALIQQLLDDLKADGVTELWLGTATKNFAGQALFVSTGAERSEETFLDYTYSL